MAEPLREEDLLVMRGPEEWHAFLEANHATSRGVWLVFFKQGCGEPGVSYSAALDEALCYGWIDSQIRRVDERRYVRKFTPRRADARWSEVNLRRAAQLEREGRIRPAGLALLPAKRADPDTPAPRRPLELPVPEAVAAALQASPLAWEHFQALAPSSRRNYILWLSAAKRAETFARRAAEAIHLLETNQPLPMK